MVRIFRARLPDGTQVMVRVWDTAYTSPGMASAEIATRPDDNATWSPITPLEEEPDG